MEMVELQMSDSSELRDKLEQISRFISQDNSDEVLRILGELKAEHPRDKSVILYEPGILIDAGGISKDVGKIKTGIHKAMVLVESGLSDTQKAQMHYNIANGHQILFSLESTKQLSEMLNNCNLQTAKHHFRQALKYDSIPDLKVNILVDYGNYLDSLGRTLEALYCYDDALKLKPEHSMAIGNRALARVFFANISGVFRAKTYIEAYQDIKSIMGKDDLISIGGSSAYETFKRKLLEIEGLFEDRSILEQQMETKKTKPKFASDFEKEYTEFCRKHKLFLNFHTGTHDDPDSILDSAFISIITPVDDNTTFYSLAKKINDIKEDFLVSKLLLFQSQFKQVSVKI